MFMTTMTTWGGDNGCEEVPKVTRVIQIMLPQFIKEE